MNGRLFALPDGAMARHRRKTFGGVLYHAFNRGSRKGPLFSSAEEYTAFENLLAYSRERIAMRIVAYCLMVNHWHLLLWPHEDGDVSRFLHWLSGTHANHYRRQTNTVSQGAVYQSRFHAVGLTDSLHFLIVCRYIERNPVEARLVQRAEDWRWSSARQRGQVDIELPMDEGPMPLPTDWLAIINSERDLATSDLTLAIKTRGQTPSTRAF
jgi:putative transposase